MDTQASYVISEENWNLHRKGYDDQRRHQQKIYEAMKGKIKDLITEENIILSRGKKKIRIPIRSLDEYKIRYNSDKQKMIGQGDGESSVGDVIARARPKEGDSKGKKEAGDVAGEDYYEAEVSIEELEQVFFEHLSLPNMKEKEKDNITDVNVEFRDIRKIGLQGNIDKKRTMLEAFKRNATSGDPSFMPIYPDDLRFKTWEEIEKPENKAVVIAMMDTSGSMGEFEKYVARSFFFWMTRFLRKKYQTVDIEFVAHHTEAKVVDEESFFKKGESGGTICSSAYKKALELIETTYSPHRYNIYAFHLSDGDNLTSDNRRCPPLIDALLESCNLFGYGEINQYNRHSNLMQMFREIEHENFRYHVMRDKGDIFHAMKKFFGPPTQAELTT
ncbi:sporulation protein YhbH [Saliterribacillus persicus]|uniref:Uncharacterized protein n=1 Tax=Saliterribacillus persicus TaxID=930114 RepID=A0A368YBU6_9BACI|nr:hypothetical protein DFR57_10136 [Saliterribacillus persicus]